MDLSPGGFPECVTPHSQLESFRARDHSLGEPELLEGAWGLGLSSMNRSLSCTNVASHHHPMLGPLQTSRPHIWVGMPPRPTRQAGKNWKSPLGDIQMPGPCIGQHRNQGSEVSDLPAPPPRLPAPATCSLRGPQGPPGSRPRQGWGEQRARVAHINHKGPHGTLQSCGPTDRHTQTFTNSDTQRHTLRQKKNPQADRDTHKDTHILGTPVPHRRPSLKTTL